MSNPFLTSPWEITDGGAAAAGFADENSDCAVRAFAFAFDIPYPSSFVLLQRLGRRRNCGVVVEDVIHKASKMTGFICKPLKLPKGACVCEVLSWCRVHDVYLVEISEHVFCIRNLQIHDLNVVPLRTKVLRAWRVLKL